MEILIERLFEEETKLKEEQTLEIFPQKIYLPLSNIIWTPVLLSK